MMKNKKLTKEQIEWIIIECICELNNFKNCCITDKKITIENYKEFNEDTFVDLPHSEYQMIISLLDTLK